MKYPYSDDSNWVNFKTLVKDKWKEFVRGIPDRNRGITYITVGVVWILMLIPYGWEMLSAFGALAVIGCGANILEKHHQAEVVAARMERDQ